MLYYVRLCYIFQHHITIIYFAESVLLKIHSTACALSHSDCKLKTLEIPLIKLIDNIFKQFLFKWSLPLVTCSGLILLELLIK